MSETHGQEAIRVNRLKAATDVLRRERRRTIDERRALEAFASRVRSIDTERPSQSIGPSDLTARRTTTGSQLRTVREAYEATVMSVPHYADEYDDTYEESVAAEFSPELAAALVDEDRLDDRTKQAVLEAAAQAVENRERLLTAVDDELGSIEDLEPAIQSILTSLEEVRTESYANQSFGELDAYRAQLNQLETNCESLLQDRQDAIFEQRRTGWLPATAPDIAAYFYQDMDVDYPVISTIGDLLTCIGGTRARVERAMAHCRG